MGTFIHRLIRNSLKGGAHISFHEGCVPQIDNGGIDKSSGKTAAWVMQSGLLKSGAFLGTGAVVGLLVGALLWRANEEPPGSVGITRGVETRLSAPGNGRMLPGKAAA